MPASQQHINSNTPMGAELIDGGATFRLWAPGAKEVYVIFRCAIVKIPEFEFQGCLAPMETKQRIVSR